MTSLRSRVKLYPMKKISLYVFLILMVCGQAFADDQAKRKALIDDMINKYHIVEKIEIPGTIPRVWVTPKFHLLTFSEKKTYIHLIYSYYYTKNSDYKAVRIFDNMTGKEIGGYMPPYELNLK